MTLDELSVEQKGAISRLLLAQVEWVAAYCTWPLSKSPRELRSERWVSDLVIATDLFLSGIEVTPQRKPGRSSQGGPTPIRPVRIDDDTWQRWKAAAEELGTDVTELIKAGTDREIKVRRRRK
jgi:hypothetical protein